MCTKPVSSTDARSRPMPLKGRSHLQRQLGDSTQIGLGETPGRLAPIELSFIRLSGASELDAGATISQLALSLDDNLIRRPN